MSIQMVGIDHNKGSVDVRALFSFTKNKSMDAMQKLMEMEGIKGAIILSTCNRMEVWVDVEEGIDISLYTYLCEIKGVKADTFSHLFITRMEKEAIEHLFHLSCGLKSQILGEDQIITQVKDALSLSRDNSTTTSALEVLFRMAITAAKKIKTNVSFPKENPSAIQQAIQVLEHNNVPIENKTCMVIGNGQMGKLAACAFRDALAQVFVTVRQYRHGAVELPDRCKVLDYDNRVGFLEQCDIVVSATTSPHFTITKEMLAKRKNKSPIILIDLAVPRDIEVDVKEVDFVTLYDIDDFKVTRLDHKMEEAVAQAESIIAEEIAVFYNWLEGSTMGPKIQYIKEAMAKDMCLRMKKNIKKMALDEKAEKKLFKDMDKAAQNTVNKMLFHLKDIQVKEEFIKGMDGLEELYFVEE